MDSVERETDRTAAREPPLSVNSVNLGCERTSPTFKYLGLLRNSVGPMATLVRRLLLLLLTTSSYYSSLSLLFFFFLLLTTSSYYSFLLLLTTS